MPLSIHFSAQRRGNDGRNPPHGLRAQRVHRIVRSADMMLPELGSLLNFALSVQDESLFSLLVFLFC